MGMQTPFCGGMAEGLNLNETMMPEHMNAAGYVSQIVGKWHLGFTSNTDCAAEHYCGALQRCMACRLCGMLPGIAGGEPCHDHCSTETPTEAPTDSPTPFNYCAANTDCAAHPAPRTDVNTGGSVRLRSPLRSLTAICASFLASPPRCVYSAVYQLATGASQYDETTRQLTDDLWTAPPDTDFAKVLTRMEDSGCMIYTPITTEDTTTTEGTCQELAAGLNAMPALRYHDDRVEAADPSFTCGFDSYLQANDRDKCEAITERMNNAWAESMPPAVETMCYAFSLSPSSAPTQAPTAFPSRSPTGTLFCSPRWCRAAQGLAGCGWGCTVMSGRSHP